MSGFKAKSPMGLRIEMRMLELELNAKQLSLAAGLNETYVRDLLKTEKPNPRYFHLKALAEQLQVSVHWIDTGEDVEPPGVVRIWDHIRARDERKRNARESNQRLKKGDDIA